ncbi:glucose-6-phosphate dehydrogenase [Nocardioides sp. GY 10127]|uniref:glucose-6-phosphate dehydrogenase n=1 Tax=Nocardioides sp. GY 10127 TaxID=2569762 RepID=UPI0010A87D60|nr:glucose-6-phosphate dehydrogenase [Nocardioides sp. GY 10127]TIC79973.1 glucose-6-phosphate dehydrogenase [Nocardioides sp. GY 10127]
MAPSSQTPLPPSHGVGGTAAPAADPGTPATSTTSTAAAPATGALHVPARPVAATGALPGAVPGTVPGTAAGARGAAKLPASCDFTVFGGTGDLALRKLLPALYSRDLEGHLPADTRIIGVSRSELDDEGYRAEVRAALHRFVEPERLEPAVVERLLGRLHHLCLDAHDPEGWHLLHELLKDRPREEETIRVFYLAVAPRIFGPTCNRLADIGVVDERARVVMEKPIGHDLESAREVNDAVGDVFAEHQIFRIDHYLGKESVQNLLVTRFANTFLEPLWSSRWVDHVQITVAETVGVGTRGGYYDTAGALRDMLQNHILQLLCLVAMEPPTYVGRENVRDEKLKVLQALRPMTPADVERLTVRGQYGPGLVDGAPAAGYNEDLGEHLPEGGSRTETFVALKAEVQNWRWAGVPFYLRTGKRLGTRYSEIVVVFKQPPHEMFPNATGPVVGNRLHIRVQPDEGMQLLVTAKEPGPGGIRLRPVSLDLSYATTFAERSPDAYERLLMDVVRGDPTLFMRRDEVEAAWTWVAPILDTWAASHEAPKRYPAGTSGPYASAALLERDGRTWQEPDQ